MSLTKENKKRCYTQRLVTDIMSWHDVSAKLPMNHEPDRLKVIVGWSWHRLQNICSTSHWLLSERPTHWSDQVMNEWMMFLLTCDKKLNQKIIKEARRHFQMAPTLWQDTCGILFHFPVTTSTHLSGSAVSCRQLIFRCEQQQQQQAVNNVIIISKH